MLISEIELENLSIAILKKIYLRNKGVENDDYFRIVKLVLLENMGPLDTRRGQSNEIGRTIWKLINDKCYVDWFNNLTTITVVGKRKLGSWVDMQEGSIFLRLV